MPIAPRLPAIVGSAQRTQRVDDPREALSPLGLMEQSLRAAAEDAGAPKLLEELDAILVPRGLWRYGDPGRLLAERVGAGAVTTVLGSVSGHIVQTLVDWGVKEIAAGRKDVVAVVGAESENSKRRMKRRGIPLTWDDKIPGEPDLHIGYEKFGVLEHERKAGVFQARNSFALCDTAWRHARGESPSEHRTRISELASRLSAVAARNPNAWIDRHVPAEEIRTATPRNRMVSYPYTKLMTSNIAVDQGAALILCSREVAERHGISESRRVYLRAATEMHHLVSLSERERLYHHPGMRLAGQRVLERMDVSPDALDFVDLYSCFPFAVQAGAEAVGLDESRDLTVTGGLTFGGGPFANYVIMSIARSVELLREKPGSLSLVGSIGGTFAKFAFGVFSTDPGNGEPPVIEDLSEQVAALPTHAYAEDPDGAATVESYVVDVAATGPTSATFAALNERGERVFAKSEDLELMEALLADEDACGRAAQVSEGILSLR
jgi:acetyl-CoA C-acetyltransferase